MHVGLVTVGDELLAGDTVNTNAAWLGRRLAARGARVERSITIRDEIAEIAAVVNDYRERYDAVIVTGGLGPTHDDLTMRAIATAFDRDLEADEAALDWLTEHGGYHREDLAAGTAHLPTGARALHNEVGVAPGCVLESVYVLPGVPDEMQAMFEGVAGEFSGPTTHVERVVVDEPESALVDRLADLRERFAVEVGSYPGEHVRIKIQGTDETEVGEAAAWLRERVESAALDESGGATESSAE